MLMKAPVSQWIRERYSCRSFSGEPLTSQDRSSLDSYMATEAKGIFNSGIRFSLAAAEPDDPEALKGLGTYGFIRGATGFIIGAMSPSDYNMEDYGYRMENIILYATSLGINTCWLGGSFTRSTFAKRISCNDDELIPAVVAVGYRADKRRMFDTVARFAIRANKRKPFEALFFDGNFETPFDGQKDPAWNHALDMVRLGPSSTNKQPWRVVRDKNTDAFHFFLMRTKNYRERNKRYFRMMDLERLDMGIAMCHFELALREHDRNGIWVTDAMPDLELPPRTSYTATWTPS